MKNYLSERELTALVETIKTAENQSTGEIRIHIDSSTKEKNLDVAFGVFEKLEMHKTKDRNAVLFHINFHQKYLTIIGDKGIHDKVHQSFWDKIHSKMIGEFAKGNYFTGISDAILETGIELKRYFPINGDNPNELQDEITFS